MPSSEYDSEYQSELIVTCPTTGRAIRVLGSRCVCPVCGVVFSSESAFDRHRIGRCEPYERRCRTQEEMWAIGLFPKPSGVVGRRAYKPKAAGTVTTPSLVRGQADVGVRIDARIASDSDRAKKAR